MSIFQDIIESSWQSWRIGICTSHDIFNIFQSAIGIWYIGVDLVSNISPFASGPISQQPSPRNHFSFLFQSFCEHVEKHAYNNSSDHDSEGAKSTVNIRSSLRAIIFILQEEDRTAALRQNDDSLSERPCLEVFLQDHMMHSLCGMALRDQPQGCFSLVLGGIAVLLENIIFPILPHQTIHIPLRQLILAGTRYENLGNHKHVSSIHKKRIDMNLTMLILVIWKKISENPAQLDFFYSSEYKMFDDVQSTRKIRPQLDILTALIPNMGKQLLGPHAKDAMLLALSIRDTRIEQFVLHETNLLQNITSELSRKFMKFVDFQYDDNDGDGDVATSSSSSLTSSTLFSVAHLSSASIDNENGNEKSTLSPSPLPPSIRMKNAESFLKVLRFCNGILISVGKSGNRYTTNTSNCTTSNYKDNELSMFNDTATTQQEDKNSIHHQLILLLQQKFLQMTIKQTLLSKESYRIYNCQYLITMAISELSGQRQKQGQTPPPPTTMCQGESSSSLAFSSSSAIVSLMAVFLLGDEDLRMDFYSRLMFIRKESHQHHHHQQHSSSSSTPSTSTSPFSSLLLTESTWKLLSLLFDSIPMDKITNTTTHSNNNNTNTNNTTNNENNNKNSYNTSSSRCNTDAWTSNNETYFGAFLPSAQNIELKLKI
eukprot:gene8094-16609_t